MSKKFFFLSLLLLPLPALAMTSQGCDTAHGEVEVDRFNGHVVCSRGVAPNGQIRLNRGAVGRVVGPERNAGKSDADKPEGPCGEVDYREFNGAITITLSSPCNGQSIERPSGARGYAFSCPSGYRMQNALVPNNSPRGVVGGPQDHVVTCQRIMRRY